MTDLAIAELTPLERYKLLIGLVIPRPIAWISTVNEKGVANCAPFSFFNVFSEEPPLCMVSFNRRTDGKLKRPDIAGVWQGGAGAIQDARGYRNSSGH